MTDVPVREIEMGQLALALVLEDFRRRVSRQDSSETEVAEIMEAALAHFPKEFEADLRTVLNSKSTRSA